MENLLPVGWVETTVGEVSTILRGVSYSKKDENKADFENACLILRGGNIQNGELLKEASDNTFVEKKLVQNQQFLKRGDVVIVGSTGSQHLLGKAAQCFEDTTDISFGAFLKTLRPSPEINTTYFGYFFQTKDYRDIIRLKGGGININNIRDGHLLELPFPLAPLSEQTRIVAALDDYMAHLRTAETALDEIPSLLRQFRQKVLAMAVSGELTREWREALKIKNRDLESGHLSDYLISIKAGKSFSCDERPPTEKETGVLKVSAVSWGDFNELESKTCLDKEKINEAYLVKTGDFLFSRANTIELVGACVIVESINLNLMLSDKTLRFEFNDLTNPKFILYYLRSKNGRDEIQRLASGNQESMRNIGQSKIREINIPLMPLAEQTAIVRRVEELLNIATEIETAYDTARTELKLLPQVLLSKAFKGELLAASLSTPLESVATLLERIKSEKARLATEKKGGKVFKKTVRT